MLGRKVYLAHTKKEKKTLLKKDQKKFSPFFFSIYLQVDQILLQIVPYWIKHTMDFKLNALKVNDFRNMYVTIYTHKYINGF